MDLCLLAGLWVGGGLNRFALGALGTHCHQSQHSAPIVNLTRIPKGPTSPAPSHLPPPPPPPPLRVNSACSYINIPYTLSWILFARDIVEKTGKTIFQTNLNVTNLYLFLFMQTAIEYWQIFFVKGHRIINKLPRLIELTLLFFTSKKKTFFPVGKDCKW
jgi:hypothetical protein